MTTILLVEDNDMNRDMLSRRLLRQGFRVEMAVDGVDALRQVEAVCPDLVLLDMDLPVKDGWTTARELRLDPRWQKLPLIALTAHAMSGDREKALACGCNDYETKPVDLPRLLGKIQALLSRTRAP